MKLAYWMYAGPAHIGTLRVASSFKNVHAIMHAPLGDDYFNVMRSMLERERDFTPVTASIVDRHVLARGSQEKVVENITRKHKEESPDLVLLTPTCTSSILQEDLHNFVERSTLALTSTRQTAPSKIGPFEDPSSLKTKLQPSPSPFALTPELSLGRDHMVSDPTPLALGDYPRTGEANKQRVGFLKGDAGQQEQPDVILADVNHYRVNELQAADRTLEQIVRFYLEKAKKQNILDTTITETPSVNIIGIFTLGFHNQHDCRELKRLFNDLGVTINEIIPEGGSVHNLKNLPKAWFNFVPYREVGLMTAVYLKDVYNMPYISTTPMGLVDTSSCIREIGTIIESILKNFPACSLSTRFAQTEGAPVLPHSGGLAPTWRNSSSESPNTTIYTRGNNKINPLPVPLHGAKQSAFALGEVPLRGTKVEALPVMHKDQTEGAPEHGVLARMDGDHNSVPQLPYIFDVNKYERYIDEQTRFISQAAWFARSIDCQNLTGKKAVVFGDATHAAAMTKILAREMGIRVSCAGTYCKHDADWFREQVSGFCDQILITDDHTQVGDMIALLEPAAIFGTQMERHVGKRLDIPCGVISAPVHIQNFPLGYRPFLGYEGANQIADLVYNSFSLGMEDHLLQIFGGHDTSRELAENASNTPHLLPLRGTEAQVVRPVGAKQAEGHMIRVKEEQNQAQNLTWSTDGLLELNKVPGFVRGKVKRNTEKYALENQINVITVEVMYAAKEAMAA